MKAGHVAVFPVDFVRSAIRARGAGTDYRLCERFGYERGRKMAPAVIYSSPDLSYVHCGSYPLDGCVEMSYYGRWKTVAFGYYNTMGQLLIPG